MVEMEWVIAAVLLCALVTVIVALRTGLASWLAIDQPNARSLHTIPTPRVGGLLTLPWALAGGLLLASQHFPLVALATLLCSFSFADDRIGLSVIWRLLAHLGVAAVSILVLGISGLPTAIVLTLALVWMINLFNFMDGADGLAGGMAVIGFFAYGVAALLAGGTEVAGLAFCIVATATAFLVFNFPPAKIFMGDAGSTTLGFLAGVVGVLGWREGYWPAWFPVLVFSPFIVDATYTLVLRGLRGEKVWHAHREHCYQRLVRMGWSHRRLAGFEYSLMITVAVLSLALRQEASAAIIVGASATVACYAVIIITVGVKWRAFQERSGQ